MELISIKILGIHSDVCHLGGHTRLFLMTMDLFKSLGHEIHIVARTKKQSVARVDMPIMDPQKAKPLLVPVDVKAKADLSHHSISKLHRYQPVRYLHRNDFSFHSIPVVYWGDHFLEPWPKEVIEMAEEADYVFVDTEMYVRMESDMDISEKHIQFVHFPTVNLMPVYGKEPEMIWANSTFTRSWIRIRWGYNNPNYTKVGRKYAHVTIPRQIFDAQVLHPPLYLDDYRNKIGFDDRPFDVVMFARLGEDKFTVAAYLEKHFNLLTMGALSPVKKRPGFDPTSPIDKAFKPEGELHATVTFKQVIKLLRQAKVYVHGKGFGEMPITGGQSLPEHFGITICEAMASGCPAIVPRSGGCWTDISMLGKYTLAYSSLEELKSHLEILTRNKEEWEKWHNSAFESVQRFDAEIGKKRIKELLD